MQEKELIKIIKDITQSEYIGDDCAHLKDLGIVVTQDSLVEDVHFSLEYTNSYQLGWKSAMVNLSDICASGAQPAYMTVAISIPEYINEDFIKGFYNGIKSASGGVKIVGGDITGSDKLYISITAIGKTESRNISSRSNAKSGYKVIVSGECIRWPKYWSFSYNISPSNEHPGLISFRMDWLALLQFKGHSRVFSNSTVQKHQFCAQLFFIVRLLHPYMNTRKTKP